MIKLHRPVGYAFNVTDLFMNFSPKRLQFTCKECKRYFKTFDRSYAIKQMFVKLMEMIITDVVENNVTVHLPPMGIRRARIVMRRVEGKELQHRMKSGDFKNIDITKSGMCAYEPVLYTRMRWYGSRKKIYLGTKLRKRLMEKTNQGFPYGDGKCDKTVKDYIKPVHDTYPFIPEIDVKKILTFGLKSLYLHIDYGGDVSIKGKRFRCFFGWLVFNEFSGYHYYAKKLSIKFRVLYMRKKTKWDGYYYFALNKFRYEQCLAQKQVNGESKKVRYGRVVLYRLYDECKIMEHRCSYIFRVSGLEPDLLAFRRVKSCFISDSAELIETRELPKFGNILVARNNYQVL